jgi:hypothetical protein
MGLKGKVAFITGASGERIANLWNSRSEEYKDKTIAQIPLRRLSTQRRSLRGLFFIARTKPAI